MVAHPEAVAHPVVVGPLEAGSTAPTRDDAFSMTRLKHYSGLCDPMLGSYSLGNRIYRTGKGVKKCWPPSTQL